jgi:hypothetical protein
MSTIPQHCFDFNSDFNNKLSLCNMLNFLCTICRKEKCNYKRNLNKYDTLKQYCQPCTPLKKNICNQST